MGIKIVKTVREILMYATTVLYNKCPRKRLQLYEALQGGRKDSIFFLVGGRGIKKNRISNRKSKIIIINVAVKTNKTVFYSDWRARRGQEILLYYSVSHITIIRARERCPRP